MKCLAIRSLLFAVLTLPAWGVGELKWAMDSEAGRFTVRRVEEKMEWRGEALAEVGYWDAAGKEWSKMLTPGESWKIERQATERGCHLVCRQDELGFSIALDFAADGDVLKVGVPSAHVVESGGARLKTLRLLPRFGAASEGDEGHLVIAQQSGALCHFRDKKPGQHFVSVYQSSCQCPMPLFGMVRGKSAVAGIITGGQFDARVCVSTCWGPQKQYAIDLVFTLRSFRDEKRLPDDVTVEYHFLPAAEANWIGIGKRYRQLNFTRRGIRPLRERAAASPGLAYSAGALEVRIRLGVKPVPCEVKEQTPETEPPMRVFCDFDRVRDILDEFYRQGIKNTEFCLVGWNRGGHDGRFPQLFPVEPKLGGEAALRATINHGQSLGYQMVAHDCYVDAYRISEDWSEEFLRKNPDGQPRKGGAWGGGQSYNVCLARAHELFARRNLPQTRALGFQGLHYSDVLSIIGPFPCYDARHPQTRRQDAEAAVRILALAQKTFGGVQSEGSLDFTAPVLDRLLYVDCDKWLPLMKRPYVDTLVPLFETVYHGTLLYSLSTDTVNTQPGEAGYLRSIEYGAVPLTYFYGHFVLDPTKNWLGKNDYRYDDLAGLKQIVTDLRRVYDDVERLKHLQMEFIEGHRQLAADVFETTYSNGQRVVVNYREHSYALPSGETVPARGYQLLVASGVPAPVAPPDLTAFILTPPARSEPRFNGAAVFGVRPGSPILYTLAVAGQRPMSFAAEGLPDGASFDARRGLITGTVLQRGTCRVMLRAENAAGRAERELKLVVGDTFALTPPMGCNTWGGLGPSVSEKGVRASAEALVKSGLLNHGYCYVNIDDGWQGERGGPHRAIQPNDKFGDMKRLCDDLHALGLKVGNYSTPWRTSYAGFVGGSSDSPDGTWAKLPPGPKKGWTHGT
ncbi:MAG: DUF5696 domain-containing protein, partial [Limisphaerales bacterium]